MHAGHVIPGACERLTLGRIPVSVFKPACGRPGRWTWRVSGMALLADRRVAQAERWWLRLDDFATRPTILPAFVAGCRHAGSLPRPSETGEACEAREGEAEPPTLYRDPLQVPGRTTRTSTGACGWTTPDDLQPRDKVQEIPRLAEPLAA